MDLDGDGYQDLLSGSYSRMERPMAGLFQVLWGQPDGTFKKAAVLNGSDGEPLIIPVDDENENENEDVVKAICTRPTAVDWDGDGDLDLVVGNFVGSFYLFSGEGEGKFQPEPEPLLAGENPLMLEGAHSDPFVVDWDGDGDLDLLSGSSVGGVFWAENTAGDGEPPALEPFQTLIEASGKGDYGNPVKEAELTGPAQATRVWADDVDQDGKLDLLVGDTVSLISGDGLEEAEFIKWQKARQEVLAKMHDPDAGEEERTEARKRYIELFNQGAQFKKHEESTGFVWFYRQK